MLKFSLHCVYSIWHIKVSLRFSTLLILCIHTKRDFFLLKKQRKYISNEKCWTLTRQEMEIQRVRISATSNTLLLIIYLKFLKLTQWIYCEYNDRFVSNVFLRDSRVLWNSINNPLCFEVNLLSWFFILFQNDNPLFQLPRHLRLIIRSTLPTIWSAYLTTFLSTKRSSITSISDLEFCPFSRLFPIDNVQLWASINAVYEFQ